MNKLLENFKMCTKNQKPPSLEILFDIAIVAMVSLIINGFIVKDISSVFDQKFFMVANAALLSLHWSIHAFFRQRYEKKNTFFRVWVFFQVLGILIMAVGIDLMVFREASNEDVVRHNFVRSAAMIIFLSGFIFSRLVIWIQHLLVILANKEEKHLVGLAIYKLISRMITMFLAIGHIVYVAVVGNEAIATSTYIFMPLYIVIELIGNLLNVNIKNLGSKDNISYKYAKARYAKLSLLFITAFFTAATTQFTFYFNGKDSWHILLTLSGAYGISFMVWWSYIDRVYRFAIKRDARNLKFYSVVNIFKAMSLVILGAAIINAHTSTNKSFIIPAVFLSLSILLLTYILSSFIYEKGNKRNFMNKWVQIFYGVQSLISIFILMGLFTTSFYVDLPIWIIYAVVLPMLLILNISSRIVTWKKINIHPVSKENIIQE